MSLHFVSQHKGKLIYIFLTIMSTYLHLQYPSKNEVSRIFYATSKNVKFTPARVYGRPHPPKKTQREHHVVKLRRAFREAFFYYDRFWIGPSQPLKFLRFLELPCRSGPGGKPPFQVLPRSRGESLWRLEGYRSQGALSVRLGWVDSRHPNGSRKK